MKCVTICYSSQRKLIQREKPWRIDVRKKNENKQTKMLKKRSKRGKIEPETRSQTCEGGGLGTGGCSVPGVWGGEDTGTEQCGQGSGRVLSPKTARPSSSLSQPEFLGSRARDGCQCEWLS